MIIVSHSGGTFGSLNVANLVQSLTKSIFVVTSEWDTQIGKQLRQLECPMFESRIFSTNVGVRPAEPCSVSVVATHALLTHIFEYFAQIILANPKLRAASGSVLTDNDLSELERCARDNIVALEEITGFDREVVRCLSIFFQTYAHTSAAVEPDLIRLRETRVCGGDGGIQGRSLPPERARDAVALRAKGRHLAQHVLETPRVWIMCCVYVMLSVTFGAPLVTGIVSAAELADVAGYAGYATRFVDAAIYLFLPQLCMLAIRAAQKRPLLHRMTGRSIVIGDCPWVAQSAEAFLSKLFACAYSATSIAVYSGNPSDHLVHRMTHRVVRGALLVCGRPDGRLTALTTLENTVSLSINQASSIQSLGYTCESLTIGHNPFQLPLTAHAVFLRGNRPDFMCEKLLAGQTGVMDGSMSKGASALLGEFSNMRDAAGEKPPETIEEKMDNWGGNAKVDSNLESRKAAKRREELRAIFDEIDDDGNGTLEVDEFTLAFKKLGNDGADAIGEDALRTIFEDADADGSGSLTFEEFTVICEMDAMQLIRASSVKKKAGISARACVEPSEEAFFGENIVGATPSCGGDGDIARQYKIAESQTHSMNLYETRIASMQRAVAMFVMFHEMGACCAAFWPRWSCGRLRYRIDRTHSIMRIATTASPVSGAEVRGRMHHLAKLKEWRTSCSVMARVTKIWQFNQMMAAHVRKSRSADTRPMLGLLPSFGLYGGGGMSGNHKKNDGAALSRSGAGGGADTARRLSVTHLAKCDEEQGLLSGESKQGPDDSDVFFNEPHADDARKLKVVRQCDRPFIHESQKIEILVADSESLSLRNTNIDIDGCGWDCG